MASPLVILLYLALAVLVGFLGRKRAVGFAGCFVLALLLTPVVMALVLMVAGRRADTSGCRNVRI
jgi:hypothetical protein